MLITLEMMAKRHKTSAPSIVRKFGRKDFYEVPDTYTYRPTPNIIKAYEKMPADTTITVTACGYDYDSGKRLVEILCTCGHKQTLSFSALSTLKCHDDFVHMKTAPITRG